MSCDIRESSDPCVVPSLGSESPLALASIPNGKVNAKDYLWLLISLVIATAFVLADLLVPLSLGCESRSEVSFWMVFLYVGIWALLALPWNITMCMGMCPGSSNGFIIAAVVIDILFWLGCLVIFYVEEWRDMVIFASSVGCGLFEQPPVIIVYGLGFYFCRRELVARQPFAGSAESLMSNDDIRCKAVAELHECISLRNTQKGSPVLFRSASKQLILTAFFFVSSAVMVTVFGLIQEAAAGNGTFRYDYFAFFLGFSFLSKELLKGLGFVIDCGKHGTGLPAYYCGEILSSLLYAFFYRAVFDHTTDWYSFLAVQAMHLLSAWLIYVARATGWYYRRARRLVDRVPEGCKPYVLGVLLTAQASVTEHDWACFVALDLAVHYIALLFSIEVSMISFWWLRKGYNAGVVLHCDPCLESNFDTSMGFYIVMLITEAINTLAMERWFLKKVGQGGMSRLLNLLRNNLFFVCFTCAFGAWGLDPWVNFLITKEHRFCFD